MRPSERKRIDQMAGLAQSVRADQFSRKTEGVDFILAKITGNTAIGGASYRWEYTWERAEIGSTRAFASRAGEAWYTGTALNVTEGGNTATTVMPGYTVANIPAGFTVKPIATGCFVMVFAQRRTDGTIQWVFWCENAIDGSC
jgi:hypothetical protein